MGLTTKTPATPNYSGAADKQLATNKQSFSDALNANRPTQISDTGKISWAQDGNGSLYQTSSLAPGQRNLLNSQTSIQQGLANRAGGMISGFNNQQVNYSGAPKMPGAVDYSSLGEVPQSGQYNQQVIDALRALQNPTIQREESANRARLAAMGLGTGTGRANQTQEEIMGQNRNDADLKAILAGVEQGNTEFNQNMQNYNTRAGQLDSGFDQRMKLHDTGVDDINSMNDQNLNRLKGLFGLVQTQSAQPSVPDFAVTPGYDTPDYNNALTNTYNANLNKTNAKNADNSAKWQAASSALNALGSYLGS